VVEDLLMLSMSLAVAAVVQVVLLQEQTWEQVALVNLHL